MERIENIFYNHNFFNGRMISGSKSGYHSRHPKNDIVFNANIFTPTHHKVWYGDLDITFDNKILQDICNEIGEEIIVVSEMMGRFGAEERTYDEIEKNAHIKFIPNTKSYLKRQYSDFEAITIDKMTIIKDKPIGWIKKRVRKTQPKNHRN